MKKILLTTVLALLGIINSWANVGDTWTEKQGNGFVMYTVLSEPNGIVNGTVSISKGKPLPTGDMIIRETVNKNSKTYTVTSVSGSKFYQCKDLTSVVISDSITSIDDVAFALCRKLTTVTIGSGLKTIGHGSFADCMSLVSIDVDNDNLAFASDDGILYDKKKETLIIHPENKNSTSYTTPTTLVTIASGAFSGCRNLTSISIGSSVKSIYNSVLTPCVNLESIYVDGANTEYTSVDGVLYDKKKETILRYPHKKSSTNLIIPNGVTSIADFSFASSHNLTNVTLPHGVTSIGNNAFEYCSSLISVTAPETITSLGDKAFYYCQSFRYFTCKATTPPSSYYETFATFMHPVTTYVPRESLNDYKTDDDWKMHKDYINPLTYTVSAKANAGGSASVSPSGEVAYNYDKEVTFIGTPENSDYIFKKWTDDNNAGATVSTDATYTVAKLDSDMALTAHFTLVDPAILLEQAKQEINKTIDDMLDEYNEDDYRPEQWEDLKDIFEEAKKEVNEMTSFEELEYVDLESLKTKADSIPTDNEMTTAELNAFNKAKADLQASITAAENKQKEAGYETKYTDETRKSVADALYNAKKTLDEYGNSTDIVTATTEMKSAIHSLDTAIERLKENPTVGIDEVEGSEPFTRDGNTIRFAQPTQIAVYSTSGQIIYTGKTEEYTLPQASGIYILRTANGSWKLAKQ